MNKSLRRENTERSSSLFSSFPILRGTILLLAIGVGILMAYLTNKLPAETSTKVTAGLAMLGTFFWAMLLAAIILIIMLVLRQYQLAAVVFLLVHLYVDWYLGLSIVALGMALALLVLLFLARSPRSPWVEPRALWLWCLFLVITISPAIRGALTPRDTLNYYPNIILGSLLMFWLGTALAQDTAAIRHLFQGLALFATFIAIHTIIQAEFGITLLGSAQADAYLNTVSNYQLITNSNIYRLGSFFSDPNWNGTFLAMMLFIPLGLFIESQHFFAKALYLAEVLIILPALLFTYSAGAWISAAAGTSAFIILAGRTRYRIQLSVLIAIAVVVIIVFFPAQLALLIQHSTGPDELSLRNGTWQTALRIISAYPLTGIGLGQLNYMIQAEPFRVPAQFIPLDHPHNSYLELGAMGGLPVLFVFLALLLFTLWQALYNWKQMDLVTRSLLGGGIAAIVALTVNSWSINGWTLPPLAAVAWLILGALSSPLLCKSRESAIEPASSHISEELSL